MNQPYFEIKVGNIILSDHTDVIPSSKENIKDTLYVDILIDQDNINSLFNS